MNIPFVLSLIVAMTQNKVIGHDNTMPWHLPSDLQRFKKLTLGKPVIMGRKTYDSIGKPLKGRTNIVVTRSDNFVPAEGVDVVRSLVQAQERALIQARRDGVSEIFIIGGAEIFKQSLAQANRIYMTEILACIEGDTFFPQFNPVNWRVVTSEIPQQSEKDTHPICFVTYHRDIVSAHKNPSGFHVRSL